MPTVPIAESTQQLGISPDSRSRVQVTSEDFGAGIAKATARLGSDIATIVDRQIEEDDSNAALDAFNKTNEEVRGVLETNDDAALTRQGKDAMGLYESTKQKLDDIGIKSSGLLLNENQKRKFNSLWTRRNEANLNSVARHENKQRKVFADENEKAHLSNVLSHVASNFDNPEEIQNAITEVETVINANIGRDSDELVARKREQAVSAIHLSVIDRMMVNNADAAKEYYDKNKDGIEGTKRSGVEKQLKNTGVKQAAQKASDAIATLGGDDAEMRKDAKKIKDPDVRAATEALVNQDIARRKEDEATIIRRNEDVFWNGFLVNPDLRDIPPDDSISDAAKMRAITFAQKKSKIETDWEKYDEAADLVEQGDIRDERELDRFKPYLKERDFRILRKSFRESGKVKPIDVKRAYINRVGKSYSKFTKNDKAQFLQFQDYINSNVKETRRPDDVDVWADRWFLPGSVSDEKFWVDDPDTFAEAFTQGRVTRFSFDIPEDDTKNVETALKLANIEGVDAEAYYTLYYLSAVDYMKAHNMIFDVNSIAVITGMKSRKIPLTESNINLGLEDLERNRNARN